MIINLSKTVFPNLVKRFRRLFFFRFGGIFKLAGFKGVGRMDGEVTAAILPSRFSRCFTIFFFIFLMPFSSRMMLLRTFFVWDVASLSLELGLNIGVQLLN